MVAAAGPAGWARAEDWQAHQATMRRLYCEQGMTLQQVKDAMEEQHGFFATPRMYKYHFKSWGFRKYLKPSDVALALHRARERAAVGETVFQSRSVGYPVKQRGCLQMAQTWTSLPLRTRIRLPDHLRLPQECIRALLDYTHGQLESSTWNHASFFDQHTATSTDWAAKVSQAQEVITKGNVAMGFRLINACFDQYRTIIVAQPPDLFSHTLSAALLLSKIGDSLADEFIRYIASLYVIVLGPHHPVSRLWSALRRGGIASVRQYGSMLYEGQYKLLVDCPGLPKSHLSNQRLDTLRFFFTTGLVTVTEAHDAIKKVMGRIAADVKFECYTIDDLLWAKLALGLVMAEAGQFVEATAAVDFVGRWVVPSLPGPDYATKVGYYVVKGKILEQIGSYDTKTDCHQAFLDMCLLELGPEHRHTTRALEGLERHFRQSGKINAADKVRVEFEDRWARLCEKEENHGRAGPK